MELYHHGIKGQRWGVRRFQNKDGTLTKAGRRRQAILRSRNDVEDIVSTMTEKEKSFLGLESNEKEYLSKENSAAVAKRFVEYHKDIPVSFFDIMVSDESGANVVIGTRNDPSFRHKGYSSKAVEKGLKWYDDHKSELGTLYWSAKTDNAASRRLAEKYNFTLSNDIPQTKEWVTYERK